MTHTFKKAVSLLLSVLMLASVCVCAFAVADATTLSDLGISDVGGTVSAVEDPTGDNRGYVVSFVTDSNNNAGNIELATAPKSGKPLTLIADTVYTVKFDYYVEVGGEFSLKYGEQSAWAPDKIKTSITSTISGFYTDFIGDGKWHTMSMTFKAEKGADGKRLYLIYGGSQKRMKGYIDNIEVITETGVTDTFFSTNTYDLKGYFNDDGTPKDIVTGGCAIVDGLSKYDVNNGYAVINPGSNNYLAPGSAGSTRYLRVISGTDEASRVILKTGYTYTVIVKYKVLKCGTGDNGATIGIGYACTTDGQKTPSTGTGWRHSYVYSNIGQLKTANTDWNYLYSTFTPTADACLTLPVTGVGAEIAIEYVQVGVSGMSNAVVSSFNDNGGDLVIKAGYKGTDFNMTGNNAVNAKLGESFMGWYTDPHFTGSPVTKFPESSGTLYARYPSVVVDFNYRTAFTRGYGLSDLDGNHKMSVSDGVANVNMVKTIGFMIPSYDAPIADNVEVDAAGYGDAYYKFVNGSKYKITFNFNSISYSGTASEIKFTCASHAGKNGSRDTTNRDNHGTIAYANSKVPVSYTHELTFNKASYDYITLGFYGAATTQAKIDSIIITDMSLFTQENFEAGYFKVPVTLDYNDGTTPSETFEIGYGEFKKLPVPPEREGYVFAGWYNMAKFQPENSANRVSPDYIPLSFLIGDYSVNGVTYTAQWVTATTVNFNEDTYKDAAANNSNGFSTGHATGGDASAAFVVEENTGLNDSDSIDKYYAHFNSSKSNTYKISLFDSNGRVFAMNGVTYNVTIRYKVASATNAAGIGIGRNVAGSAVGVCGIDGLGNYTNIGDGSASDEFKVATKTVTAENMYRAENGSSPDYMRYRNQISIRINSGEVYIDYVEITPVSYKPSYQGFDSSKGDITNIDVVNKTVTVAPIDGFEVAASGLSVSMNYRDFDYLNSTVTVVDNPVEMLSCRNKGDEFTSGTEDGLTFKYTGDYSAAKLNALKVTVDFVAEGETNAAFIAGSIRDASGSGKDYVSAGIRFRARVDDANITDADMIEFIIVPKDFLGEKTIKDYMEAGGGQEVTGVAYSADDNKNVVYEKIGTYTDYQAVVTGLTKEDGTNIKNLQLCAALRITKGENVEYVPMSKSYCYDDLAQKSAQ